MARETQASRRRVRALKAMAHPARLAVVDALAGGELCVCDLQAEVGSDLSTVSRHLKLMADAGLIESRRDGQRILYRLTAPCIVDYLRCMDAVLDGRACRVVEAGAKDQA